MDSYGEETPFNHLQTIDIGSILHRQKTSIDHPDAIKRFDCFRCGRLYKYKRGLDLHLKYECNVEPQFHCKYCPYRAKRKFGLESHMRYKHLKNLQIRINRTK